ncbi:MAG: N-6 DNA methylase [Bacteroidales bacterium]|nr:N-6 DNA methylase [Bacteroidales bacterium]
MLGGSIVFSDITNDILEKNIYGVDINEESVDIAKLSLWLRTAQKGRKLNTLSNNIKCGNSLIDDPEIAGDKAFNWQKEFSEIFEKGGFDIVIGNPPYVNFANLPLGQREYFKENSNVFKNKTDLYAFFVEKSTKILKPNGKFSFIFPHTWVSTSSFTPLRKLFIENYSINSLVELEHGVFQDAVVKTVIIVCTKNEKFTGIPIYNEDFQFKTIIPKNVILNDNELLINFDWNSKKQTIENKLFKGSVRLDSILRFTRGIKTSNDKRFLFFERKNEEYKRLIRGRNIKAYRIDFEGEFIWYRPDLMKEKVGCLPHTKELFEVKEKLITQRVNSSGELLVTYDDKQYYCLDTTNVSIIEKPLDIDLKYLLVILNSKLINWWFNDKFKMPTISGYELHQIPIKVNKSIEKKFIEFANLKLKQSPEFRNLLENFISHFQSKFDIEKLSNRIQNWHELNFKDFLNELKKFKIKLTLSEEAEWMQYFNDQKNKVQLLKEEIEKTDKEIDQMIYELYGLSEEEIKIVENV